MTTKIDILAFGSHPDDVELGCAGTLLSHISSGRKAGIVDLTRGELGTRGTIAIRKEEAEKAAGILGVKVRINLGFKDGFFQNDKKHQLKVISVVRKYRPEIVLTNAPSDRHPDHGKGCTLVTEACFLSGLSKIKTKENGIEQKSWRPRLVLHYIQFRNAEPDIIVDISNYMDKKMEAIRAHSSQFYNPKSKEPETLISAPDFFNFVIAKAVYYGKQINMKFGEAFISPRFLGVNNLFDFT